MINHVRTLLLNRAREGNPDFPGEEYVPRLFRPVSGLPTVLTKIRNSVFGSRPDRYLLNYRLQQIMAVLHVTELDEHVRAFDPRITYWPPKNDDFYALAFGTTAKKGGKFVGEFIPVDALQAVDATGQMFFQWRVEVDSSSQVTVRNLLPPVAQASYAYTVTEGLSSLIPLLGSSQLFRFHGPVGAVWIVTGVARPVRDMGRILADLRSGLTSADTLALFGTAPEEPYRTYRNLWQQNDKYGYQIGAVMLALARRTGALIPGGA